MNRGFTLIEMLVSIALFAIIMTMALGALLSLSVADRRAEATKSAMDNLTFALDSMSRAIRTGSIYHCGSGGVLTTQQDCSFSDLYFTFVNSSGQQVYYQIDLTNANCGTGYTSCIERSSNGVTWTPITSPDLIITAGSFTVVGADPAVQPTVFINVSGSVLITGTQQSTFRMQTDVTQRIYDL